MRDNKKCDHPRTLLQSQSRKQSQRDPKKEPQKNSPYRLCFNMGVAIFYFVALKINADLFGLSYVPVDEEVFFSISETRQYFFNACLVPLGCLAMIAFSAGKATIEEKIYGVTYFLSLVLSALRYNNADRQEWFWLYDLDALMQYGITATLYVVAVCQLLQFISYFWARPS